MWKGHCPWDCVLEEAVVTVRASISGVREAFAAIPGGTHRPWDFPVTGSCSPTCTSPGAVSSLPLAPRMTPCFPRGSICPPRGEVSPLPCVSLLLYCNPRPLLTCLLIDFLSVLFATGPSCVPPSLSPSRPLHSWALASRALTTSEPLPGASRGDRGAPWTCPRPHEVHEPAGPFPDGSTIPAGAWVCEVLGQQSDTVPKCPLTAGHRVPEGTRN